MTSEPCTERNKLIDKEELVRNRSSTNSYTDAWSTFGKVGRYYPGTSARYTDARDTPRTRAMVATSCSPDSYMLRAVTWTPSALSV